MSTDPDLQVSLIWFSVFVFLVTLGAVYSRLRRLAAPAEPAKPVREEHYPPPPVVSQLPDDYAWTVERLTLRCPHCFAVGRRAPEDSSDWRQCSRCRLEWSDGSLALVGRAR